MKVLSDLDVKGRRVLLRCDFNVPLKDGKITDDTRLVEALPTIKQLVDSGARVILMSHLGRPKGQVVEEFSLRPVSKRLSELLAVEVGFTGETIGETVKSKVMSMEDGQIFLLENLRYFSGEKENDPKFVDELADLGELFVQDAFGTVHRKHASMVGVPSKLPSAAGKLLEKEIAFLTKGLSPEKPLVVCLGGAKLETKIPIIENMLEKADVILVGGAMAYTLLKVQGKEIGSSMLDAENLTTAENILKKSIEKDVFLGLPVDHVIADDFSDPEIIKETGEADIEAGFMGLDIGPKTRSLYREKLLSAKTIVLNGPMGVFEDSRFSAGTKAVFDSVKEATSSGAVSILGGGDTVAAITGLGFEKSAYSHVSTGGGASLKFLEGKVLPGIEILA